MGTTVLALIGLFNIVGTYTAGWLGGRMSKPRLLTGLYLLRAVVIVLFLWAPVTQLSAYLFGMAMGLLWLSTVPLTNGTVATLFRRAKFFDARWDCVLVPSDWFVPRRLVGRGGL